MARVAIVAHWQKIRVWVICPYVGRLHPCISVFAIGHSVPREPALKIHFSHAAPGVFDKPKPRREGHYEAVDVEVHPVAKLRII